MNPLIALFQTPNGKYFFDTNKDEMISINDESFAYLTKLKDGNVIELQPMPAELLELKEQGYLKEESAVKEICHPYTKYLDVFLERKIDMMTLQLTQDCNLRCKYCIYSEEHTQVQRSHSMKSMSWETAKKAVDFFRDHSIDNPKVNLGFYGGEPLLEFPLLKKIIEYSNECFMGKELSLSMTTNGTLLTDEMILYLSEYDVTLMISLDGPKEINDLNRIFADGSGTFDTISRNISRIKEITPDYVKKLYISMVVHPENDFDCANELRLDGSEFSKINISPMMVDREFGNEDLYFPGDFIWKSEYHNFLAMLAHYGRYPISQLSPIADRVMSQALGDYLKTGSGAFLRETDAPSGPCIPGQMRLFINADGLFFPCERVSEKSPAMCLGSLDEEFNFDNARKILNIGALTKEECLKCWGFRYCGICAKKADDKKGQLSAEFKKKNCQNALNRASQKMEHYLLLKEISIYYARQVAKEEMS